MTSRRGGSRATPQAICRAISKLLGAAACAVGPSPRGPRNRQQFAKLRECNRMRLAHELRTGRRFAWIVRARLDMLLPYRVRHDRWDADQLALLCLSEMDKTAQHP